VVSFYEGVGDEARRVGKIGILLKTMGDIPIGICFRGRRTQIRGHFLQGEGDQAYL